MTRGSVEAGEKETFPFSPPGGSGGGGIIEGDRTILSRGSYVFLMKELKNEAPLPCFPYTSDPFWWSLKISLRALGYSTGGISTNNLNIGNRNTLNIIVVVFKIVFPTLILQIFNFLFATPSSPGRWVLDFIFHFLVHFLLFFKSLLFSQL